MQHYAAFHLGLHCLSHLGVSSIQRVKDICGGLCLGLVLWCKLTVLSCFAFILLIKRELVALLY